MGSDKIYIAIDLKSFYASVEAVDLGLDPLTANLVVADPSRTEKTICLAVSPSLKAYGISGRARLFEVVADHVIQICFLLDFYHGKMPGIELFKIQVGIQSPDPLVDGLRLVVLEQKDFV